MPKWNIDKGLAKLAKLLTVEDVDGTIVQRVMMDNSLLENYGLRRDVEAQPDGKSTQVWTISLGQNSMPKLLTVYGYTIYETFQKARKGVKTLVRDVKKIRPKKAERRRSDKTNGAHTAT